MRDECINIWTFGIGYLFYSSLSCYLFVSTSSGWMRFFNLWGTASLYIIIALVVSSVVLISRSKGKRHVLLNRQWFILLLISQLLAILFNVGDCGDANGDFNFFERILGINGCHIGNKAFLGELGYLASYIFTGLYFMALILYLTTVRPIADKITILDRPRFSGDPFV